MHCFSFLFRVIVGVGSFVLSFLLVCGLGDWEFVSLKEGGGGGSAIYWRLLGLGWMSLRRGAREH